MVAALSVCRHGPASRSAALRKTAARSSKDSSAHAGAASFAQRIASSPSAGGAGALRGGGGALRRRPGDGGGPGRLDDVEPLAARHPLPAAQRAGQLDLLVGQFGEPTLEGG